MKLRKRKATQPYDIWEENSKSTRSTKSHPSSKRNKKAPLPHPGQSYNPDPEDHKKLLQKVLEKELAEQKKEASIGKALDIKVDRKELQEAENEELVSGIKHLIKKTDSGPKGADKADDGSEESSTDSPCSDYDEKDFLAIVKDKTVVEKRKSKQQRLRQLKDRLQRKAAKLKKLKNIRLSKFDSIKKVTRELDKKEKEEASKVKRHRRPKNERLAQKFEQSDPIYYLSEELPSSLRETSCPMNAIVREQLESFQSRIMVEPTSYQVKKRKYKKRQFDRDAAD